MINRRTLIRNAFSAAAISAIPCHLVAGASGDDRLPTRPIPSTGEALPILGLGNSQAFRNGDLEVSRQLLSLFLKKGGAYVDSSGAGRSSVGPITRARQLQDELFLGSYISAMDDAGARQEIAEVQMAQGSDVLDMIQTRNVGDFAADPGKYRRWKDEGLCRYLGVARSNASHYEVMMKLMARGDVDFIQTNYSLFEPEAAQQLLPMAQDKGIAVLINRPFLNGRFFSMVKGRQLPEWAAEFDCASWAQFSLKFILAHPAVNCVLTETANPKHLTDNLDAGFGRLPDEKTRQRMRRVIEDLS
jgi:aryl-alcohol dehydrogenase-like predicted oxidoreductase